MRYFGILAITLIVIGSGLAKNIDERNVEREKAQLRAKALLLLATVTVPPESNLIVKETRIANKINDNVVNNNECNCAVTGICTCEGDCPCEPCFNSFRGKAIKTGKPLIVWVKTSCPTCENELTNCLHYHMSELYGNSNPHVVVGMPRDGELYQHKVFNHQPSVDELKAVCNSPISSFNLVGDCSTGNCYTFPVSNSFNLVGDCSTQYFTPQFNGMIFNENRRVFNGNRRVFNGVFNGNRMIFNRSSCSSGNCR